MPISKKDIIRSAYVSGVGLYGRDLVYRSAHIKYRTISARVKYLLDNDCDPCVAGLVDDYEYAFILLGTRTEGIEASGLAITDPAIADNGLVCLYDPEFGIDVLRVDMTTEQMYEMINNY